MSEQRCSSDGTGTSGGHRRGPTELKHRPLLKVDCLSGSQTVEGSSLSGGLLRRGALIFVLIFLKGYDEAGSEIMKTKQNKPGN